MAIITNQARLSYSGGVASSNITTGEIVAVLSASKTALEESYSAGDNITYIISIVNTGTSAYSDLTVTDDLGAYTYGTTTLTPLDYREGSLRYYTNGVLQAAPTVSTDTSLTISGIAVPAGGNATLIYAASTNGYASPLSGGTIVNTAVISGSGLSDITVSESVTADSSAELSITKAMSPVVVAENGRITYTFTIQNSGNAAANATDDVILSDTFTPILNDITVTYNGTAWSEGTEYTYSETSGEFATVSGAITVPAAAFTQDASGEWTVDPGVAVITVSGTV